MKKKCNLFEWQWISLDIKEVEITMYQSNTYRRDLNWICFGNALKG